MELWKRFSGPDIADTVEGEEEEEWSIHSWDEKEEKVVRERERDVDVQLTPVSVCLSVCLSACLSVSQPLVTEEYGSLLPVDEPEDDTSLPPGYTPA